MFNSLLLIEALVVGILVVFIGVGIHLLSLKIIGAHDINSMPIYISHLFVIGIATHLICEYTGVNKWYCTNGNACR